MGERIKELEADVEAKEDALQSLSLAYNDLESHLAQTQNSTPAPPVDLNSQQQDHLVIIGSLEEENHQLKEQLAALRSQPPQQSASESENTKHDAQQMRIQALEEELRQLRDCNQQQQQKHKQLTVRLWMIHSLPHKDLIK